MTPDPRNNRLLARLAPKDLDALRPHLEAVDLPLRLDLEKPGRRIDAVYFPETGIASVVAIQSNDTRVEVGLIGCEGMSGIAVVLGNHQTPNSTYMQLGGAGHRMSADALRDAMAKNAGLQIVFLKYVQAFLVQTSHTAICNARSRLDERLARWILMAHDRATGSTILLTHEFLALMLGVRRAGVTQALQALVNQGLVKSARGEITVLDRKGLEGRAGDSYGVPEREYRRLLGGGGGTVDGPKRKPVR
jgi:CRP-like cAMP-binding protein